MTGYRRPDADVPYSRSHAVVPSDAADLPWITFGLYAAGAGNVSVILAGDTDPRTFAIAAGGTLRLMVRRVRATGTTATGLLALQ